MYQTQPSEQTIEKATEWIQGFNDLLEEIDLKRLKREHHYRSTKVSQLKVGDLIKLNLEKRVSKPNSAIFTVKNIIPCGAMYNLSICKNKTGKVHSVMVVEKEFVLACEQRG